MKIDKLMEIILQIIPSAVFDEDNDGQIIIYTGYKGTTDGELVSFDLED